MNNIRWISKEEPLQQHIMRGNTAEVSELLDELSREHRLNLVNCTDADFHRTPLHYAAEAGSVECCEVLIKEGANVHKRDHTGATPLSSAASGGHTGCCKVLVEAGAHINTKDNRGWTPLHKAVSYSSDASCVEWLLEHKADPFSTTYKGKTPFDLTQAYSEFAENPFVNTGIPELLEEAMKPKAKSAAHRPGA